MITSNISISKDGENWKPYEFEPTSALVMIKASDLRLGNWVLSNNPFAGWIPVRIGAEDFANFDENEFKAIALTPEILEKAGFKDGKKEIGEGVFTELDYDGHYNVFIRQIDSQKDESLVLMPTELKYLHQLQNLYFAFTGEELEINL